MVLALLSGCADPTLDEHHPVVLYSNDPATQENKQLEWTAVRDGLAYSDSLVHMDDGTTHEFFVAKVDPHLFEFKIYNNKDEASAKNVKDIHDEKGSVLTFNGAFFDEKFKSMGLLQDSSSTYHKLATSDLMNGVFAVANKTVEPLALLAPAETVPSDKTAFMIQNGPALIDNVGQILLTKDTGKTAGRTAMGVDKDGNVVVVVLHQTLLNSDNVMSLYAFAHLLKENAVFAPMQLHSVLNLDGGPSTGIAIGGEYLPESNNVQNVVITVPRAKKI